VLKITLVVFMFLEFSNVIALYQRPDFKYANAVGMFNAWKGSERDPEVHDFVRYLVNWVAGSKLIFLALLVVILIFGNDETQIFTLIALILTISIFYWKLYPIIKRMDGSGQITPRGYSRTLFRTITGMVIALSAALIITILLGM
jgi:hypothetical protein